MQHDDLDREQAICDAATEGPWYDQHEYDGGRTVCTMRSPDMQYCVNRAAHASGFPGDKTKENGRFAAAARTAWPARIEECRRLRDVIADWKVEENLWKEREAALLEEIERLKAAGKVLARYLEDMDDQGYHPVPIDAQDRAAAKLFHPLWEGD